MPALTNRRRWWSFTLFRSEHRYFWPPLVVLAAICYLPLLLTRPGRVTGDTLDGLYLDPSRTFLDAANRWDPGVSFGAIVDRTFGAAFPMAPYYWLTDVLGVPVWIAQRFWMGSILLAAALGVVSLLRVMRWDGPAWIVAPITYISSPYILSQLGIQSVTLLAFAALPWLISFTVSGVGGMARNPWRDPARFGIVVGLTLSGSLSAFLGILPGPLLWVFYVVVATREIPWRTAAAALGRIIATSAAASAWWFIGLLSRPRAEIAFARERDPVARVASASIPSETIRSLGEWRFYTHFGRTSLDAGFAYQRVAPVILASFVPVAVALLTLGRHRFRNRIYFVSLFAMGVVLSSGMSPAGDPEAYGRLLEKVTGVSFGSFLLPTVRCAPLTALAVAVAFAAGMRYIVEVVPDRAGPLTVAASLVAMAGVPAFYTGHALDGPLLLADDVPEYWHRAADDLDRRDPGYGVLEVPGLFTSEYEWGTTRQPVSMSLISRTVALRTPDWPSQPATSDLLAALDEAGSSGRLEPEAVAPLARLLGVDTILLRRDTPADDGAGRRWQTVLDQAVVAGGLRAGSSYGYEDGDAVPDGVDGQNPQLYVYEVIEPQPLIRLIDPQYSVVIAGTGPGLVSLANHGIVAGREAVRYAASLDADAIAALPPTTPVVVTDSSRWTEVTGETIDPIPDLDSLAFDSAQIVRSDQPRPISEMSPDDLATTVAVVPELTIDSTSFHRTGLTMPEHRPANAFDGDPETVWITQQLDRPGEALFAEYQANGAAATDPEAAIEPLTEGFRGNVVEIRQPGPELGFALVTSIRVRTGSQTSPTIELTEESWSDTGQRIELAAVPEPYGRFEVQILSVTGSADAIRRGAGFREVRLVGDELLDSRVRVDPVEVVVAPTLDDDLAARAELPLAFLFERWVAATDAAASPETHLARVFSLASTRTFDVSVTVSTEIRRVGSECAGAMVTIDRVPVELRFEETVNGRAVGRGTRTLDPADRHTLVAAAPAGCELVVDGVLLSDGVGRRAGPARPVAADFIVDQTSATSYQLTDVSVPRPLWLTLGTSYDSDWAGGGPAEPGPPELLNGFAASWYIDTPADAPFIFTARWTPQRVVSVGVILSVFALMVLLGLAIVPSWKPGAGGDLLAPETLRAGNSNVVVLSVLGVFGIAAGAVPAILAACAALLLEARPQYHRRISWSAPVLLGVAAGAKAIRAITGESDGLAALAGPRWIEVVTYSALALAVTAALANTERPPIRRYPTEPM